MKLADPRLIIVGGAAVLTILIIALPARRSQSEQSLPAAAHPLAAVADDRGADSDAPLLQKQRERREQVEWARDPFAPAPTGASVRSAKPRTPAATSRSPVPTLRGISLYGGDARAVIDGEIVQTGDRLASGYIVGKISARSVTLARDQEQLVLTLGDQP